MPPGEALDDHLTTLPPTRAPPAEHVQPAMAVEMDPRTRTPGQDQPHTHTLAQPISIKTSSSSNGTSMWHQSASSNNATGSANSSENSSPNEEVNTATTHTSSSVHALDSPHKRKRSEEDDGQRSSPHRQYDYSPPRRAEQPQHMADRALHVLRTEDASNHYSNAHPNGHWGGEYSAHPQSAQSNGAQDHWSDHTPNSAPGYDHDPSNSLVAKRKRNFANRTKTGCLTCRKRKKKCDEQRPLCKSSEITRRLY
jgi:hypothetical protein